MPRIKSIPLVIILLLGYTSYSQVVTVSPSSPTINDEITLTFDVKQATNPLAQGLLGLNSGVYLWSGAGDDSEAFTYEPSAQTDFGQPVTGGEMTPLGNDVWEITITPRTYFEIPGGVEITRLGLLLKNTNGSAQTEDLFIDITAGDFISFTTPTDFNIINFVSQDELFTITANSSSVGDLELFIDEGAGFTLAQSAGATNEITFDYQVTSSLDLPVKVVAELGAGNSIERTEVIRFFITTPTAEAPLPADAIEGINYIDEATVTLVLRAPLKDAVYVIGDFTNWELNVNYQMQRDPDGETYWLTINGLTPGQEYIFQYWVDGTIKIGDPYSDKIVDPWNDRSIPATVYPDLIEYTRTEYGMASVLQTDQAPFSWDASEDSWVRPEKEKLVIYELLVRDFIGTHNYNDLVDTLSYLKELGVNAIELMPIMEFDGNESWGYNPAYFFAPDKYYGTKNDLKNFIQTAHQQGFAVILDMVLNHATGSNPHAAMYWDAANSRPTPSNPWFNVTPTHDFNVFNDFNHESLYTKDLVDTVNRYWIEEYHFDGYRFDLSKGFTQNNTLGDIAAWGRLDQSRVDILTDMANSIWDIDPGAYVILEHFADQEEEDVLADAGMLLWRNMNEAYREGISGNNPGVNLEGANTLARVSYMESHDEERLMFENLERGAASGNYDITIERIALDRVKLGAAFFYTLPGPKMMWQFQELGYDLSINTCSDGVTITEDCRVANKPLPWGEGNMGLYEDELRQELFAAHKAIIGLTDELSDVFDNGLLETSLSGVVKRISIEHVTSDVIIVGNFGLQQQTVQPRFTTSGVWYDYFSGMSFNITGTDTSYTYFPGEFHIYTTMQLAIPRGNPYSLPAAPTVADIADQVGNENGAVGPITLTITPGDLPVEEVMVTVEASNTSLFVASGLEISGIGETRQLTLTPRPGRFGTSLITLTVSDGLASSTNTFTVEIREEIVTSLFEEGDNRPYRLFPNPTNGYVFLEYPIGKAPAHAVIDPRGKRYDVPYVTEDGKLKIYTQGLSNGIYLIQLSSPGGTSRLRLVVE